MHSTGSVRLSQAGQGQPTSYAKAVILFPLYCTVIVVVGSIALFATATMQLIGGCPTNRVVLLDKIPDVGILLAALLAFARHPLLTWRKVFRHAAGCTVGEVAAMPLAVDPSLVTVNRLLVLTVNGAEHVVRLRGHDMGNPLLLYAHGGPGYSEMLRGGADLGLREEHLEQSFVVVDFDQRGSVSSAALNYAAADSASKKSAFLETMTLEQHTQDAVAIAAWVAELPDLLAARASKFKSAKDSSVLINKVHLCGGSWGSVVALNTAAAKPGLFATPVIVRGLVTDQVRSESIGYRYILDQMAKCNAPKEELEIMEKCRGVPQGSFQYIGAEGIQQMLRQRGFLGAYGGSSFKAFDQIEKFGRPSPRWKVFFDRGWEMMLTPEVPLSAAISGKKNMVDTLVAMSHITWKANAQVQPRHISNMDVLVAQGVTDNCTATVLVEEFLKKDLSVDEGRKKQLSLFERSGHAPCKEEPAAFASLARKAWGVAKVPLDESTVSYSVVTL